MNKEEKTLSFNIKYENDEIFHHLLKEVNKNNYHWFKIKMKDGSELDLVEKKDYEQLQQENKQLKGKIDKAIEYISNQFVEQGGFTSYEWNDLLNEILQILKGNNEDLYFTEEEYKAEEKVIERLKIDKQDNFYDYYKGDNNE